MNRASARSTRFWLRRALPLGLAIGVEMACGERDRLEPSNTSRPGAGVAAPPDPDAMEARARELPGCRLPAVDSVAWIPSVLWSGTVRLHLPRGLVEQPGASGAEQTVWMTADSSLFLVARHDGGGSTSLVPQESSSAWSEEEPCSVEFAGRLAEVTRYQMDLDRRRFYFAAVDVVLDRSRGMGAAVMSTTAGQRDTLLAVLPTIRW